MAVDEEWGFSKNGSMPWPKNIEDLKHFKEMTLNGVVIMGRLTWEDPKMPTPLKNRINEYPPRRIWQSTLQSYSPP